MADDEITDDELRRQLIKLGQNPGPISDTTRKQWRKKLASLIANVKKSSKPKAPSRKLLGFSSDESEPETENARSRSQSKGRAGGGVGARSRGKRNETVSRAVTNNDEDGIRPPDRPILARPSLRSRSNVGLPSSNDAANANGEQNQDGNFAGGKNKLRGSGSATRAAAKGATGKSRVPAQQKLDRYSFSRPRAEPEVSTNDDFESSDSDSDMNSSSVGPELHSMAVNTSPSLDLSLPSTSFTRNQVGDSLLSDDNTPQGVSRRTSSRTMRPRNNRNSLSSLSNQRDGLSSNTLKKSLQPSKARTKGKSETAKEPSEEEKFLQQGFKVKEEDPRMYKYSQYCSVLIVLIVLGFFFILGGLYWKVRHVDSPKACGKDRPQASCIDDSEQLVRECNVRLWDYLSRTAGDVECGYVERKDGKRVNVDEVKKAANCGSQWKKAVEQIFKNPEWKISVFKNDLTKADKTDDIAWMESEMMQMSLFCRFKRAYDRFILIVYMAVAVVAVVLLIIYIMKYRRRKREEESRKVYDMVEKIIDTLKQHHEAYEHNKEGLPYVAILHARDMLIPIKERKRMQKTWDEAVKFLEANESRVREETQTISGEEFIVWRWLQGCPNGGKSKVWQGQAFGEHTNANLNKMPCSPSPCLKVRNMFDADIEYGNAWPMFIQDAILEKCAATCPDAVYHVAVDKSSTEGCVYIKCSSPEAAGKVFAALHGWWFDGNLVTVKYIRLERYHERFPYATAAVSPLKPSNNEMKSMSQPFHRSALERS